MGGKRTNIVLACPDAWATANPETFTQDLQAIGDTDGFAVRTIRNTVYIVANEPKGVLNGASMTSWNATPTSSFQPSQRPRPYLRPYTPT